jgi:hypothetical protein
MLLRGKLSTSKDYQLYQEIMIKKSEQDRKLFKNRGNLMNRTNTTTSLLSSAIQSRGSSVLSKRSKLGGQDNNESYRVKIEKQKNALSKI